jgi:hypothetical protein
MPARSDRTSRFRLTDACLLSVLPPGDSIRVLIARVRRTTAAVLVAVACGLCSGLAAAQGAPATPPATPLPDMGSTADKDKLFFDRAAWDAPEPWRTDSLYFQFAYYTWHFHYDPDHQQSYLADFEYRFDKYWLGGQWIGGFSLFQNSFGQFSQYVYGAMQWRPWEEYPAAYVKLSAGLLHGYAGEYKNKIPFNDYGTAPAIIPSVGYCWNRYCGEFVLLGLNAALFTVGVTMP